MKPWKQHLPKQFYLQTKRQQILFQLSNLKKGKTDIKNARHHNFKQRQKEYLSLLPHQKTCYLADCMQIVADETMHLDWYLNGHLFHLHRNNEQTLKRLEEDTPTSFYNMIKNISTIETTFKRVLILTREVFKLNEADQSFLLSRLRTKRENISSSYLNLLTALLPYVSNREKLEELISYFTKNILPLFLKRCGEEQDDLNLIRSWFQIWIQYEHPYFHLSDASAPLVLENPLKPFEEALLYIPVFLLRKIPSLDPAEIKLIHHLAQGKNIRTCYPFRWMSKKMAHLFIHLPDKERPVNALGYWDSYLLSLGIQQKAIREILNRYWSIRSFSSNLKKRLENKKPFLLKIKDWFPASEINEEEKIIIRRLAAYAQHCEDESIPFCWTGRTLQSTLRVVQEWESLLHQKRTSYKEWKGATYDPLTVQIEGIPFRIIQLTNSHELAQEGRVLNHCVGGYVYRCQHGTVSIWSLQKLIKQYGWQSLSTISVNNKGKIIEAKGSYNCTPPLEYQAIIKTWVRENQLVWINYQASRNDDPIAHDRLPDHLFVPPGANDYNYDDAYYYPYSHYTPIEDLFDEFCFENYEEDIWDEQYIKEEYFLQ